MLWNTSILPAGSPFVALRKDFERRLADHRRRTSGTVCRWSERTVQRSIIQQISASLESSRSDRPERCRLLRHAEPFNCIKADLQNVTGNSPSRCQIVGRFFATVSSAGKPSGGGIRGATTFDVCHLCRLSKIRLLSSVVVIPVKFFGRIA